MICNRKRGVIYTGHTDDLGQRMGQHKARAYPGFAAEHGCHKLLWFETHGSRHEAFVRERQIKEWKRKWKVEMLEVLNPDWDDLTLNLTVDEVYSELRMFKIPVGDGPRLLCLQANTGRGERES